MIRRTNCDYSKNLRFFYDQSWHHARHQEMQRLKFTALFTALFGVVLTFSANVPTHEEKIAIYVFLAILSIFGIFIIDRWNEAFLKYRAKVRNIHTLWNISDGIETGEKKFTSVRAAIIYPLFYFLCFGVSLYSAGNMYLEGSTGMFIRGIFMGIWILFTFFFFLFYKKRITLMNQYYNLQPVFASSLSPPC
jgi:hypothetical protein